MQWQPVTTTGLYGKEGGAERGDEEADCERDGHDHDLPIAAAVDGYGAPSEGASINHLLRLPPFNLRDPRPWSRLVGRVRAARGAMNL
jgi:hypothetical protein